MNKARAKQHPHTLAVAMILCLLACIGMVLALMFGQRQVQAPFVVPPFDTAAVSGAPDADSVADLQTLDANVFRVKVIGEPQATGTSLDVWFCNPEDNDVWLKLRIMDTDGRILGESGLIKPGEYLRSVALHVAIESEMPVVLKVMAYEPETYHSYGAVSLNTNIIIAD